MKKLVLLFVAFILLGFTMKAQVRKIINCAAGDLVNQLTTKELSTITDLTITGVINAQDFTTMKSMPVLAEVNLSATTVAASGSYVANSIPLAAFQNCSNLMHIQLPESIISIGSVAFANCSKLVSVNIPESVNLMGHDIFADCSNLTSVNIPSALKLVNYNMFNSCSKLFSITIPSNVTSIGDKAFQFCDSIKSIYMVSTVPPTLGIYVFDEVIKANCKLYVPVEAATAYRNAIGWKDFVNIIESTKNQLDLTVSVNNSEAGIVSGVGTYSVNQLTTAIATANIGYTFSYWTENGIVVSTDASYTFNITENRNLVANFFSTSVCAITAYVLPVSSGTISGFGAYDALQAVSLTATPTSGYSFKNWTENGVVVSINSTYSFSASQNRVLVANFIVAKNIDCTAGNLVNLLTSSELYNITNLTITGVIDARDFTTIRDKMPNLKEIDLSRATVVAYSGIEGPNGNVTINYKANEIPVYSFKNRSEITQVKLPETIVSIGSNAFENCCRLRSIKIPESVSSTGRDVFSRCTNLNSVILPASLTVINYDLFAGTRLSSIIFPATVTSIYSFVFNGCTNIKSICSLSAIPPTIWDQTFSFDKSNVTLYVPIGARTTYLNTTYWKNFGTIKEIGIPILTLSTNNSSAGTFSGSGTFAFNQTVTVSASANNGFKFSSWTENGIVVSFDTTYTFNITESRNLVANFATSSSYSIVAYAQPENTGTITGTGTYDELKSVTLTAIPTNGYIFKNWTENGTVVSTDDVYTFTTNADRNLIANFSNIQYNINVADLGDGSASGGGIYAYGKTVCVSASPKVNDCGIPSVFLGWSIDGSIVSGNQEYCFTPDKDLSMIANFSDVPLVFQITAYSEITSGVQKLLDGSGITSYGLMFSLTAPVEAGYTFAGWKENGAIISTDIEYSDYAYSDRSIEAVYQPDSYIITASVLPENTGIIKGSGTYTKGQSITLTANHQQGYVFHNWTENGIEVSSDSIYSFAANANRTLVANFQNNVGIHNCEISNQVNIFPNPTNSILYINRLNQNATISIIDINGKIVLSKQVRDNKIDVSNLANGIYNIKISDKSGEITKKFVKQ